MQGDLRQRLFWVVTLIAVIPLLGLSAMGYLTARREMVRSVQQNLQGLVRLQVLQLNDYFRQKKQHLHDIGRNASRALLALERVRSKGVPPANRFLLWKRAQRVLESVLAPIQKVSKVSSLGVVNRSGQVLVWLGVARPTRPVLTGKQAGIVGIYHFSKASETVMRMSQSLDALGLKGLSLVVDFPFSIHQRFLQEKQAPAFRGDILLLDQHRKVMCGSFDLQHSHHLFGSIWQLPFVSGAGDRAAQSDATWGVVHRYAGVRGVGMFGIALPMKEVPWTLLIELPEHRAFLSLFALRNRGLVVLGLSIILLLGTVAWSSERVSRDQKREMEQVIQREKMAAIGILASGVAHEIGNPLASIMALVERLQMLSIEDPEGKIYSRLQEIDERGQTIVRILDTMRDYARKRPDISVPLDPAKELQRAEQLVRFDRRLQHISIEREIAPHLPLLWGREDALQQVFTNLLLNAIDALEGRTDGRIRLRAWPTCDGLICQVCDNGPGFSPAVEASLFSPFVTTKGNKKGTGLGLAVSHQLIAGLGGTLGAKRSDGETVMEIFLPTHPKSESAQKPHREVV